MTLPYQGVWRIEFHVCCLWIPVVRQGVDCFNSVDLGCSWTFTVIIFNNQRGSTLFVSMYIYHLPYHFPKWDMRSNFLQSFGNFLYSSQFQRDIFTPRLSPFFIPVANKQTMRNGVSDVTHSGDIEWLVIS